MGNISIDNTRRSQKWWIRLCQRLYQMHQAFWSMFLVSVLASVFAASLFFRWPWSINPKIAEEGSPIQWVLQHPLIFLLGCTIWFLLSCIIGVVGRLDMGRGLSEKQLQRSYLLRMIRETKLLALPGTSHGLVAESIPLDEVFIPLRLQPNRPLSDYPLSKDQLEEMRASLRSGIFSEEMQQILLSAEKSWHLGTPRESIALAEFWQRLTRETPAAVVQGYPGMGKSTLLGYLTLLTARCCLNRSASPIAKIVSRGKKVLLDLVGVFLILFEIFQDPFSEGQAVPQTVLFFEPLPLVPILMRLGDYAAERSRASETALSLSDYLKLKLDQLRLPGLSSWMETCLVDGRCLVLLDGLDEIGDPLLRRQVRGAIATFVLDYSDSSGTHFNRFLITSRVAGYDQAAFPYYSHFTIAELTTEKIAFFLPCWYAATMRRDQRRAIGKKNTQERVLVREVECMANRFLTVLEEYQGVRELAKNPFLLTLLLVMQQNGVELPKRRVELYAAVTHMLLEGLSLAKDLPPLPLALTIEQLGPIALHMQETGDSFVRRKDVMASLRRTMAKEGETVDHTEHETERFLNRLRERGGLFVQRTGDYFGFFHRTFQEYFAARYMLYLIASDPERWTADLVGKARRRDDYWRESFLLAVASISDEDETIARRIVHALIETAHEEDFEQRAHDLLLAAESLIEAKPLALGMAYEKQTATQLLTLYREAHRHGEFQVCDRVEAATCRWLTSLTNDVYHSAILEVLRDALADREQVAYQRDALVLLGVITSELDPCPPLVFSTLIPPLLDLADLPPMRSYSPAGHLPASNPLIAHLATLILSLMGGKGPSGLLMEEVCQHIGAHPEQLRLLAHSWLESHTLFTPILVPQTQEHLRSFTEARAELTTYTERENKRVTEQEREQFLMIHRNLIDCAEEFAYPSMIHFVGLLQTGEKHADRSWQDTWSAYLAAQLDSSSYSLYQDVVLLWFALFSGEEQQVEKLATLVAEHLSREGMSVQRKAFSFVAMLSSYRQALRDDRSLRTLSGLYVLLDQLDCLGQRAYGALKWQRYHEARIALGGGNSDVYFALSADVSATSALLTQLEQLTQPEQLVQLSERARTDPYALLRHFDELDRLIQLAETNYVNDFYHYKRGRLLADLCQQAWQARINLGMTLDRFTQQALRSMRDTGSLRTLPVLRAVQVLQTLQVLRALRDERIRRNRSTRQPPRPLTAQKDPSELLKRLLTQENTAKAAQRLTHVTSPSLADSTESLDLLSILLGRLLQIQEAGESGRTIEQELHRLAQVACSDLATANAEETKVRLAIVRSLPARSAREIGLVTKLAEETADERIHLASAQALQNSAPSDLEAWKTVEAAAQSPIRVISTAAEERIKQRE